MNSLPFINSKDVRAYLEHIGYAFSPSETAWLIYQCRGLTLKERHAAWRQLAAEFPEAPFLTTNQRMTPPPIGDFLQRYIETEEKLLERFLKNDGSFVYCLYKKHPNDCVRCAYPQSEPASRAFFSFGECVDALKAWYQRTVDQYGEDEIEKEYRVACRSLGAGTPLKNDALIVRCDGGGPFCGGLLWR